MKKIILLLVLALFASAYASAQQPESRHKEHHEHHEHRGADGGHRHHQRPPQKAAELQYNADGIETTIVKAFPQAKSVRKAEKWTEVYDGGKKLIGYAVYSKPASDGIKGFGGETPVLIALDRKKVVKGVYLLPNVETPGFEKRVADAGFYNSWNGLSVKKALKKEVDAVSGATFTSRAVAQTVQAALKTL